MRMIEEKERSISYWFVPMDVSFLRQTKAFLFSWIGERILIGIGLTAYMRFLEKKTYERILVFFSSFPLYIKYMNILKQVREGVPYLNLTVASFGLRLTREGERSGRLGTSIILLVLVSSLLSYSYWSSLSSGSYYWTWIKSPYFVSQLT